MPFFNMWIFFLLVSRVSRLPRLSCPSPSQRREVCPVDSGGTDLSFLPVEGYGSLIQLFYHQVIRQPVPHLTRFYSDGLSQLESEDHASPTGQRLLHLTAKFVLISWLWGLQWQSFRKLIMLFWEYLLLACLMNTTREHKIVFSSCKERLYFHFLSHVSVLDLLFFL